VLGRVFRTKLGAAASETFRTFEDNDPALEYCEDRLLERLGFVHPEGESAAIADFELLTGFTGEEVSLFENLLGTRHSSAGDVIIEAGADADELFLLGRGRVSVFVGADGSRRRLATFSPGMVFGEMALFDRSPRSATIIADSEVECRILSLDALDQLGIEHPGIKIKLLENLGRGLSRKLRKANVELSVFE
jgi:glutaminase